MVSQLVDRSARDLIALGCSLLLGKVLAMHFREGLFWHLDETVSALWCGFSLRGASVYHHHQQQRSCYPHECYIYFLIILIILIIVIITIFIIFFVLCFNIIIYVYVHIAIVRNSLFSNTLYNFVLRCSRKCSSEMEFDYFFKDNSGKVI